MHLVSLKEWSLQGPGSYMDPPPFPFSSRNKVPGVLQCISPVLLLGRAGGSLLFTGGGNTEAL